MRHVGTTEHIDSLRLSVLQNMEEAARALEPFDNELRGDLKQIDGSEVQFQAYNLMSAVGLCHLYGIPFSKPTVGPIALDYALLANTALAAEQYAQRELVSMSSNLGVINSPSVFVANKREIAGAVLKNYLNLLATGLALHKTWERYYSKFIAGNDEAGYEAPRIEQHPLRLAVERVSAQLQRLQVEQLSPMAGTLSELVDQGELNKICENVTGEDGEMLKKWLQPFFD